jgi:phosphatidate cytidylyltransferase
MKRLLTAAALIPVIVYVVLWSNQLVFLVVLAAVAFLCYREYDSIAAAYGFGSPGLFGLMAGMSLLFWPADVWLWFTIVALIALALAMRARDLEASLPGAALAVTGIIYVFGTWRCAIPLWELNRHWLMFALLVNWAGDIGAYYVGRRFGKHKLAPRVSPKKTWEGSAASVVTSMLLAGGYLRWLVPGIAIGHVVAITAVANIAGQIGDLAESAMKRGAGVKDSGAILPGHGGFLDRVDSTLFSLPVVYLYLKLAGAAGLF